MISVESAASSHSADDPDDNNKKINSSSSLLAQKQASLVALATGVPHLDNNINRYELKQQPDDILKPRSYLSNLPPLYSTKSSNEIVTLESKYDSELPAHSPKHKRHSSSRDQAAHLVAALPKFGARASSEADQSPTRLISPWGTPSFAQPRLLDIIRQEHKVSKVIESPSLQGSVSEKISPAKKESLGRAAAIIAAQGKVSHADNSAKPNSSHYAINRNKTIRRSRTTRNCVALSAAIISLLSLGLLAVGALCVSSSISCGTGPLSSLAVPIVMVCLGSFLLSYAVFLLRRFLFFHRIRGKMGRSSANRHILQPIKSLLTRSNFIEKYDTNHTHHTHLRSAQQSVRADLIDFEPSLDSRSIHTIAVREDSISLSDHKVPAGRDTHAENKQLPQAKYSAEIKNSNNHNNKAEADNSAGTLISPNIPAPIDVQSGSSMARVTFAHTVQHVISTPVQFEGTLHTRMPTAVSIYDQSELRAGIGGYYERRLDSPHMLLRTHTGTTLLEGDSSMVTRHPPLSPSETQHNLSPKHSNNSAQHTGILRLHSNHSIATAITSFPPSNAPTASTVTPSAQVASATLPPASFPGQLLPMLSLKDSDSTSSYLNNNNTNQTTNSAIISSSPSTTTVVDCPPANNIPLAQLPPAQGISPTAAAAAANLSANNNSATSALLQSSLNVRRPAGITSSGGIARGSRPGSLQPLNIGHRGSDFPPPGPANNISILSSINGGGGLLPSSNIRGSFVANPLPPIQQIHPTLRLQEAAALLSAQEALS
jgi:hypothetical protein